MDPAVIIESAWTFQDRCALSFWDALILGAAQALGCGTVLSEDLPTGHVLEGIRILSPLKTRPAELAQQK